MPSRFEERLEGTAVEMGGAASTQTDEPLPLQNGMICVNPIQCFQLTCVSDVVS